MRKKTENFVTEKYLLEIDESELDLANLDEVFKGKDWSEEGYDTIRIPKNKDYGYEGEAEPININLLEKVIAKMKKSGATYMEIMHHGDHHGYVFQGLEVRKSTPEEIEMFQNKNKKKSEINKEYSELEKKMKELEKEYKKI